MGRPGWWGDTQESSSFRRWFFMKNIDYFGVKKFLSNRQTFRDSSYHVWIQVTVDDECWISHRHHVKKIVMHNGIDKVCGVKCTAQWDCLRGAGVTLFWIGWEHDLSPHYRLTSSADRQIQTIVSVLMISSRYEGRKYALSTQHQYVH